MNSCKGNSEIILIGQTILHGAKDEGSFEAHAPCLRDAFDGGTKMIQLAEAKLGSEGLSTGQEDAKNRIDTSPTTGWRRPCTKVVVYLSIDHGKLLGEHRGVKAGSRKRRASDDESRGAQLPKSKASIRMEVDSEECHNVAEADLLIAKKRT
ncbi:hypothetical protein GW17_00021351 [Ensete ventricosum]|nr:hypothetical protein GW17_00021351 [Ensete ventricosum]